MSWLALNYHTVKKKKLLFLNNINNIALSNQPSKAYIKVHSFSHMFATDEIRVLILGKILHGNKMKTSSTGKWYCNTGGLHAVQCKVV